MGNNDKEKLYLHILSPVHVGGGREKYWINGVHYLYDNRDKIVRVFDIERLGEFLSIPEINQYTNSIEIGNVGQFFDYLANTRKIPFKEFSTDYFMPYQPEGEIKTMIRTGLGDPYLPGSSIKGAIRSAIFCWAYQNNYRIKENIDRILESAERRDFGKKLDESLFGKIDNNLMRFIQVSDAMFSATMLFNTKVFNLWKDTGDDEWYGGWKHAQHGNTGDEFRPTGFSSTYEAFEVNDWSTFSIKINKTAWDLIEKYPGLTPPGNGDFLMNESPLKKLFGIINFATRKYILSEIEFFERFPAENSDHIINELNEVLETVPLANENQQSCVLKLGAGTGFHAITGNWQYNDYTDTGFHSHGRNAGKKKFKSRKVSFSKFKAEEGLETLFFPMGFVKIYTQEAWDEV